MYMYMKTGVYTQLLSSVELTTISFFMYGVQQLSFCLFMYLYCTCMYAFTCYRCTQL